MVQVEYLGETKTFSPQEISAMVLTKVNITTEQCRYRPAELRLNVTANSFLIDEGDC